jgi:hypothetical protein
LTNQSSRKSIFPFTRSALIRALQDADLALLKRLWRPEAEGNYATNLRGIKSARNVPRGNICARNTALSMKSQALRTQTTADDIPKSTADVKIGPHQRSAIQLFYFTP